MSDTMEDVEETVEDQVPGNGNGGLAKKLLIPAAAGVGTLAATVAARKAPDLFRDKVMPRLEQKGGEEAAKIGENALGRLKGGGGVVGTVAGKAGEKLTGGGGGGGREKTRRLPIQRWTDIAVPVNEAYERWTQFEEFPKFMHRVLNVERTDDEHLTWEEKIWFSKRQWEGEITEQRKNDRIAWKTTKGTSHTGVVTFHKLDAKLTRVMVTMDFHPSGMMEKMASGLRFVKRAVQSDLARFKAYCEFGVVEGLEYAQPGAQDDQQKDDQKDEQNGEPQGRGDRQEQDEGSSGNGDQARNGGSADAPAADPEQLEQSRQERAERRQERRTS